MSGTGGLTSSSKTLCRSCAQTRRLGRTFTTSAAHRAQLPPESPEYVDFPKPEQPNIKRWQPIKGLLPVPRDIFAKYRPRNKLNKVDKASALFALRATAEPERRRQESSDALTESRVSAQDRVSALRRQNLRDGVRELAQRRDNTRQFRSRRAETNRIAAQQARDKPPSDAEQFTGNSVSKELRLFMQGKGAALTRAPSKEEVLKKKGHYRKQEDKARAVRQRNLHSLWLQARYFITSPEDLTKALDAAFDQTETYNPASNIWQRSLGGKTPPNMAEMYELYNPGSREAYLHGLQTETERMQKLAEVLTGGRIQKQITEEQS